MKKIGLFLIAAMAVFAFTSCNDDTDGDYPRYTPLITTVRTIGGEEGEASADYYFQRDNGEKLYPSDKTRVPDYKGKERQRAIIWFNLLKESVPDYDYNIALYAVDEIFTGKAQVVNTAEELEALGTAKTGFKDSKELFNLSKEWLTFYALYAVRDNSKHTFTLAVDKSGTTEFKESAEGTSMSWCVTTPETTQADTTADSTCRSTSRTSPPNWKARRASTCFCRPARTATRRSNSICRRRSSHSRRQSLSRSAALRTGLFLCPGACFSDDRRGKMYDRFNPGGRSLVILTSETYL